MFNVGMLIQNLMQSKQQHDSKAEEIRRTMLLLEERLDRMSEVYERHMGAAGALAETIASVQRLAEGPGLNANDPTQESDM